MIRSINLIIDVGLMDSSLCENQDLSKFCSDGKSYKST